jgi:hypothetical protein
MTTYRTVATFHIEVKIVQEYLRKKWVIQQFTKPAIPEQNAHIESYYSIMEIGPLMRSCLSEI